MLPWKANGGECFNCFWERMDGFLSPLSSLAAIQENYLFQFHLFGVTGRVRPRSSSPGFSCFSTLLLCFAIKQLSRKTKTRKHSKAFVERKNSVLSQLASKYSEKVKSCIECKILPHVQRAMKKDISSKSTSVDSMCKANTMPRPCFCNGTRKLQSCSTCSFCTGGCAMICGIGTTSSPCYSFGWSSQTWCTATIIGMQLVAFAR